MTDAGPLPPQVKRVVAEYRARLDGEHAVALQALYLVGSVALGDFRPGASDVDFVAVVADAPGDDACDALGRIHAALAESGGPCFDGVYLTEAALRQPPADYAAVPFSLEGRFRTGEICREVNPVVWRCLARSGWAVLGPPPAALGIADDGDLLRGYQLGNLRSYWLSWIAQVETALAAKAPGEDCRAEALAWGVLGVSRIACTLETGRVVSKGEGGHHALATRPERWHPVLREALSIHAGGPMRVSVEAVREGLGYMRAVIGEAPGEA